MPWLICYMKIKWIWKKLYHTLININSHLYGIAHNFQYTLEYRQCERRFGLQREWCHFLKSSVDTLWSIVCLLVWYSTRMYMLGRGWVLEKEEFFFVVVFNPVGILDSTLGREVQLVAVCWRSPRQDSLGCFLGPFWLRATSDTEWSGPSRCLTADRGGGAGRRVKYSRHLLNISWARCSVHGSDSGVDDHGHSLQSQLVPWTLATTHLPHLGRAASPTAEGKPSARMQLDLGPGASHLPDGMVIFDTFLLWWLLSALAGLLAVCRDPGFCSACGIPWFPVF